MTVQFEQVMTNTGGTPHSLKVIDSLRRLFWPSRADVTMTVLLLCAAVTAIVAEILFRRHGFSGPYWTFLSADFFVSYALISLGILHAWRVRQWREILAVAIMASVAWFLIGAARFDFVRTDLQQFAYAVALGTGLVQLVGLGWQAADSAELVKRIRLARDSGMFAIASALPTPFIVVSGFVNPTLDHLTAHFDDAYGIRFVSLIRWVMDSSDTVREILSVIYFAMPLAIALFFAFQRKSSLPPVPLTVWLSSAFGVVLYLLLPVAGPGYAYPDYYASFWPVADVNAAVAPVVATIYPRNCMPSLHSAWAYLIVFGTYGLGTPVRIAGLVFCALTLIAAIEIGNHWFIDLVIALPFALAIQALACHAVPLRAPERLQALGAGVALTGLYVGLLLVQPVVFPGSILVNWAMLIATVWITIYCWIRLARRLDAADAASPAQSWWQSWRKLRPYQTSN